MDPSHGHFGPDTTLFKDPSNVHQWMSTGVQVPNTVPDMLSTMTPVDQAFFDESLTQLCSPTQGSIWNLSGELCTADLTTEVTPTAFFPATCTSSDDGSISGDPGYEVPTSVEMAYSTSHRSPMWKGTWQGNGQLSYPMDQVSSASYSVSTAWSSPCSISPAPIFDSSYEIPDASGGLTSPVLRPGSGASMIGSDFSGHDSMLPAAFAEYQGQCLSDVCRPDLIYSDVAGDLKDDGSSYMTQTVRPILDHSRPYMTESAFWPQSMDLTMALSMDSNTYGPYRQAGHSSSATAREHPLYHVEPSPADGLYHCPYGPIEGCKHKPDKLKCNYEYVFRLCPLVHMTNTLQQALGFSP